MEKNKFFTFLFALIPGAGQMYLGCMNKGLLVMLIFVLNIALCGFLNVMPLIVLLPVIWFYSFFDTFNLRILPREERQTHDNKISYKKSNSFKNSWSKLMQKYHILLGVLLLVLGVFMLYQLLIYSNLYLFQPWAQHLLNSVPTLLVGAAIIVLGVFLLKGGKKTKKVEDDYVEYRGDKIEK